MNLILIGGTERFLGGLAKDIVAAAIFFVSGECFYD